MVERECKNCWFCNLNAFHRGKWYCNNPNVHIGVAIDASRPCFKSRIEVETEKKENINV